MLKFKTSCAVLAYLSSNLLNEVGLSLFRYFEVGLRVWDIVVKKFTFAISSPDEFLYYYDKPYSGMDFTTKDRFRIRLNLFLYLNVNGIQIPIIKGHNFE